MATVQVTIAYSKGRSSGGAPLPVLQSVEAVAKTATTSGTSAVVSGLTVTQAMLDLGAIWVVTAKNGDVYVEFGTGSPTAAADYGFLVMTGSTREFAATTVGEVIAMKDA